MEIWTIGHFNHSIEHFVQLLMQQRMSLLVDVRRFPGSRAFPQFNQESLDQSLTQAGMRYLWLEALGGRRPKSSQDGESPNEGWQNKSFRNYADYMLTQEFRSGFEELAQLASSNRTAIMCAESVFWRCHRRLISDYVVANGGTVEHIFPDGRTRLHTLTDIIEVDTSLAPPRLTYPPPPAAF